MRKLAKVQFFFLLVGMIFSLGIFANDLFAWLEAGTSTCLDGSVCPVDSAPGNGNGVSEKVRSPFLTAYFYLFILFLISWLLNAFMWILSSRKEKREIHVSEENVDESE